MIAGVLFWLLCAVCVAWASTAGAATGTAASSCTQSFSTVTAPGGGNNFTITPTTGHVWEITSLRYTLSTGAGAGIRTPFLRIVHSASVVWETPLSQQSPSSVSVFEFQQGPAAADNGMPVGTTTYYYGTGLPAILLSSSESMGSTTTGQLAGDSYTAISFSYCDVIHQSVDVANSPTVGVSGTVPVLVSGTPTVNAVQSGAWPVTVSGGSITASAGCPGAAPTTSSTATTTTVAPTTTTTYGDTPCAVQLASFSGDGQSIVVGFGVVIFCAVIGVVLLMVRRRSTI